jgi:hypothetical protein
MCRVRGRHGGVYNSTSTLSIPVTPDPFPLADLIMVGLSSVIIGYPSDQEPHAYSRWDVVSLRHAVRLEPQETTEPTSPAESG